MFKGIQRLKTGLVRIGKILNRVQKVFLGVLFWAIIVALLVIIISNRPPGVPDKAALVLNPVGDVVEQLSGNPMDRITSLGEPEVLLKDLLDAVRKAKDDERIRALVLKTDRMGSVGMSKLLDLKSALDAFKKTGKKIIAAGDDFDQSGYFLAAQADEVYIHPMGMIFLQGFSQFSPFFKEGLDKLNVDVHVFRVGEYKSAVEPFLRNTMSEDAKRANLEYLNDLWADWLRGCAAGRGITVEALQNYINRFKDSAVEARGDMAKIALEAKLVDKIANRDETRDRLIQLVGADVDTHSYRQIGFMDYLASIDRDLPVDTSRENIVGVVVAKGEISDGSRPPGEIGGDSTAALIRKARFDKNIKAIVLRVDSPGGSAFASEIIRRECALARKDGKPVIVSMGSVAASGGYWISTASDEIWASPATITGSIGVFGLFPSIDQALSKLLGVHMDGVGTTPMSGIDRMDRPYNPEVGIIIQQTVDRIYDEFLTRVAEARNMEKDAVNVIARGRVWSGEDALKIGLVDKLGELKDALDSAAEHAGLGKNYQIQYIEPEMTRKERIMATLFGKIRAIARTDESTQSYPGAFLRSLRILAKQADTIAKLNDPNGVYAYCPFLIGP